MIKKDLLEKIKDAKEEDDINALLAGTDIETQFKGPEPNLDVFKQKIKEDKAFQKFMDSERDTYHSKALKTMKEKGTWESEFADNLKEKYPELVTDPVQLELMKERQAREQLEAKLARKELLSEANKYAGEKGITIRSIERYLGDDLDATKANLDELAEDWSKALEATNNQETKETKETYVYNPKGGNQDVDLSAQIAGAINGTI